MKDHYDIHDLKKLLNENVEEITRELYPQGKQVGSNWVVGGVQGHKGNSCTIGLSGKYRGVIYDHQGDMVSDDGQARGDLIDAWMEVKGLSKRDALAEIRARFGIEQRERVYKPVELPKRFIPAPVTVDGFLESRGISQRVIDLNKVIAVDKHWFGPNDTRKALGFVHYNGPNNDIPYMVQYRSIPKKGFISSKDGTPCLYGWHTLPTNCRRVALVEGMMDKLAADEYGFDSLSLPFGGGRGNKHQWIEIDWYRLLEFDEFLIFVDNDKTGLQARREIASRLGINRCRFVSLPDGIKDLNDALMQAYSREDIDKCIQNATWLKDSDIASPIDTANEDEEYYELLNDPESGMIATALKTKIDNEDVDIRFIRGDFVMIQGLTGAGKTQFALWLMLLLLKQETPCYIMSPELNKAMTMMRIFKQMTGKMEPTRDERQKCRDWLSERGFKIYRSMKSISEERLFEMMDSARKQFGIYNFFIDNKMTIKHGSLEEDKAFAERLRDYCQTNMVNIFMVMHERKPPADMSRTNTNGYNASGASEFYNISSMCLIVKRNYIKEKLTKLIKGKHWFNISFDAFNKASDGAKKDTFERIKERYTDPDAFLKVQPDTELIVSKSRHFTWTGKLELNFNPHNFRYTSAREGIWKDLDFFS